MASEARGRRNIRYFVHPHFNGKYSTSSYVGWGRGKPTLHTSASEIAVSGAQVEAWRGHGADAIQLDLALHCDAEVGHAAAALVAGVA